MPTSEAAGHPAGFAANWLSVHAFCRVVSRAGRTLGNCTSTFWMFASPGFCPTLTSRPAPLALLVTPGAEAENDGANGRPAPPPAAKALDTPLLSAASPALTGTPVIVAVTCLAAQLVGLKMKAGRLTSTLTLRNLNRTPSWICGRGSELTVNCPVLELTATEARTTTLPRLKGPATAGTTIDRPNG